MCMSVLYRSNLNIDYINREFLLMTLNLSVVPCAHAMEEKTAWCFPRSGTFRGSLHYLHCQSQTSSGKADQMHYL